MKIKLSEVEKLAIDELIDEALEERAEDEARGVLASLALDVLRTHAMPGYLRVLEARDALEE